MGARAAVHPTDQTLQSYGLGMLDVASAESVSKHLELCSDCQCRVAEMSSDSFLGRLRDACVKPEAPLTGPVVSSLAGLSMLDAGASATSPPAAETLPPGLAQHPDYEVIRELGQGGMGTVYLAKNRLMGRYEVLKVVTSHLIKRRGVLDWFLGEIRNAARLHHTNIVMAYSASRLDESIIFAMEYVEGLDLAKLVKAKGALPVANACNYIHQAALGLQHAHEQGMVHRDIKPSNLMLARQGSRAVIKVLDFGLAKIKSEGAVDSGLTHEGQMLGTPDYISPEQISDARRADIRADIYSLGCTLYYLLVDRPPFQANSLYDLLQAHHSMDATPLNLARPEVPVALAALVAKMMAKEPERRFQSPNEVAKALAPFFKKGSPGSVESRLEFSQVDQTNTRRAVSAPAQAEKNLGRAAVPSENAAGPATDDGRWESLIEIGEEEPSINPIPSRDPAKQPSWKKWPIAMAGSAFGLLALGVITSTIFDKDGRETGKVIVPDGSKVVIEGQGERAETKYSENTRDDQKAGINRLVTVAGEPGGLPAGKASASSTDPLQVGTSWRGTSTLLVKPPLPKDNNSIAYRPRAHSLTIKSRAGAHFKAVAYSFRGSHEAEGTFGDGVIRWGVQEEGLTWEGKLHTDRIVGTFKGINSRGALVSGEFQLGLVEQDSRSLERPVLIPARGPAREALNMWGAGWTVEGNQLVKDSLEFGFVSFGDRDWADYDLTFESLKSAGPGGFAACFRADGRKQYLLTVGDRGDKHVLFFEESLGNGKWRPVELGSESGKIEQFKWYKVKISLRGPHVRIELDDRLLFALADESNKKGWVQLRGSECGLRFRNIKVTAPDGTKLWDGPPDLP
jgi:serine/threonine protein kinase